MSDRNSPNRSLLMAAASALRPLLPELVFVGGTVAELLITDPASSRIRETDDVDVIVEAASYGAYRALSERLVALGFSRDSSPNAPVCRWLTPEVAGKQVKVDVMPTQETQIGPANEWYQIGMATAQRCSLTEDLEIRVLSASAFIATKWAAFKSRGNNDILRSHDVEDIITVVAGRPSLPHELRDADAALRSYIAACTREFLDREDVDDALEDALLPDARLTPAVVTRTKARMLEIGDA